MPFRSPFPLGPRPAKGLRPITCSDMSPSPKTWLSLKEAAIYLKNTPECVREWIESGQLLAKPIRHGSHWRYRILKQHLELFVLELATGK